MLTTSNSFRFTVFNSSESITNIFARLSASQISRTSTNITEILVDSKDQFPESQPIKSVIKLSWKTSIPTRANNIHLLAVVVRRPEASAISPLTPVYQPTSHGRLALNYVSILLLLPAKRSLTNDDELQTNKVK